MEATEAAPSPLCAPGAHLRHPQPSSGVPESARPCDVTGPGATHGPRTCPRPGWWGPTRTPPSAPPPHQRPRLVPGRPQRPAWGDPSAPTPVRRLPAMKTRHPPYMQYLSVCLSVCPCQGPRGLRPGGCPGPRALSGRPAGRRLRFWFFWFFSSLPCFLVPASFALTLTKARTIARVRGAGLTGAVIRPQVTPPVRGCPARPAVLGWEEGAGVPRQAGLWFLTLGGWPAPVGRGRQRALGL